MTGTEHVVAAFERLQQQRAGEPAWLRQRRQRALEGFCASGLPTRRDEDWKYTNVSAIDELELAGADEVATIDAGQLDGHALDGFARLVMVDGRYRPELSAPASLPAGVVVSSLGEALASGAAALEADLAQHAAGDRWFGALNTALMHDGLYVHVPAGVTGLPPIQLLHVHSGEAGGAPRAVHPRHLIVADRSSEVRVLETYLGPADCDYLTNAVTEVVVREGATVEHYKVQLEGAAAYHVATIQAHQQRDSNFSSLAVSVGGRLARNDINSLLDAEGGHCSLNGLYLVGGSQHVDHHTAIDHAKPHCTSAELYKGILGGRAQGVFNGKIFVRADAQKTDAVQSNKNLLLSDEATINTKPQLEILADDVRCTHGATVGQLDADALFYLRSRGVSADEARRVLIYSFAGELVGQTRFEPLRAYLAQLVTARVPMA